MKFLPGMALLLLTAIASFADGITSVEINGYQYTDINKVYVASNGRIIILFPGGGTSESADKIPAAFLESWNINKQTQAAAKSEEERKEADEKAAWNRLAENEKAAQQRQAAQDLDRAIAAGCFREVGGTVYDMRKPQPDWTTFEGAKVIQVLDKGAILDTTPDAQGQHIAILVRNLTAIIADTDFITVTAKLAGNFTFINQLNDDRTIRAYDAGRPCQREEIPEAVLNGVKSSDLSPLGEKPNKDIVASLPESGELRGIGSGFFVTEDGYLITANHVVQNARKIKIKNSDGVFTAEIARVDKADDLALLKISGKFKPLAISAGDAQLGDPVFTVGFPNIVLQGTEPKYTDGKISSLAGVQDDPTEYQISVPIQPGNSGGPLVDMAGNVQGVIVAKLDDMAALNSSGTLPQNVNYALKGKYVREFLQKIPRVKFISNAAVPDGKSAVQSVEQSVAMILVY
jgi:S1-C subfamily serine protease